MTSFILVHTLSIVVKAVILIKLVEESPRELQLTMTDNNFHFLKHVVTDHCNDKYDNLKYIRRGFRNNTFKRKVGKALLIKGDL